jgi:hypothetical protein
MGRPPIGKTAMTSTERSRRRRLKLRPKPATKADQATLAKAQARIRELEADEMIEQQESMIERLEWMFDTDGTIQDRLEGRPMNKRRGTLGLSLIEELRTLATADTRAKCAGLLRQGAEYLIGLADELAASPAAAPAQREFTRSEQKWLDRMAAKKAGKDR